MAEVSLNIHGKNYGVACDDGQEGRVVEVGRYVDSRARDIAAAGAAGNEMHLLVLTSLVLADEIKELQDFVANNNTRRPSAPTPPPVIVRQGMSEEDEAGVASAIDQLASRIAAVADRLMEI